MIRDLHAYSGRCRCRAVSLALLLSLLLPAGVWAQRAKTAPETVARDTAAIRTTLYFTHGNGDWIERSEYKKTARLLRWAQSDTTMFIHITGWADKSGTATINERLSLRRARTVRNYLVSRGIDADRITIEGRGVDMQAANDEKARRADVREVVLLAVERAPAEDEVAKTEEEKVTKAEEVAKTGETVSGAVPERKGQAVADTTATQPEQNRQETEQRQAVPEQTATVQPQQQPGQSHLSPVKATPSSGRYLAVKTNLAAWAGTIMNVAADVQVGKHISVELPVLWCPWYVSDKHAVKTFTIQPEGRYWPGKPGEGHFFGVHAHVGWFSVKWDKDRYQDTGRPLLGAGISYGYLLPFSEHWAGEFTLGAGYANMKYDTYYNIDNGARIDTRTKNYWGITRVGISVVYRFNLKK